MIGLQIDPKLILVALAVLLAVGIGVGSVAYHEATTASLRADVEAARKASAQAATRAADLEIQVRQSAAEVAAANRATEAARRQAATTGQIQKRTDRMRAKNREVIHEASISYPQSFDAPTIDRPVLWRRINQLFGVCSQDAAAAGGGAGSTGLHGADAP
jgi:hypothetical protein